MQHLLNDVRDGAPAPQIGDMALMGMAAPPSVVRGDARRERRRLAALFAMDILQSPREPLLERIVQLACTEFGMDSGALVLIDHASAILHVRIGTHVRRCPRKSMPCNIVISNAAPLILQDVPEDPITAGMPMAANGPIMRSYAGFPLLTRDGLAIGTLALFSDRPNAVPEGRIDLGQQLAGIIMDTLELRRLALNDPLTGALNRRGFMVMFEEAIQKSSTEGTPLSFAMLDVDHFKSINDRFGHGVGDQVLRALVNHLMRALGAKFPIGRLGGEEFAVLLQGLDAAQAHAQIEEIRQGLAAIQIPDASSLTFTASFGLAELEIHARNASELLAKSDAALYEAKHQGRNRTMIAPPL